MHLDCRVTIQCKYSLAVQIVERCAHTRQQEQHCLCGEYCGNKGCVGALSIVVVWVNLQLCGVSHLVWMRAPTETTTTATREQISRVYTSVDVTLQPYGEGVARPRTTAGSKLFASRVLPNPVAESPPEKQCLAKSSFPLVDASPVVTNRLRPLFIANLVKCKSFKEDLLICAAPDKDLESCRVRRQREMDLAAVSSVLLLTATNSSPFSFSFFYHQSRSFTVTYSFHSSIASLVQ